MSAIAYRGVVKDRVVVVEGEIDLPDGTEVVVTPVALERGSREAFLAALREMPRQEPGAVDELRGAIEEGREQLRFDNPLTARN